MFATIVDRVAEEVTGLSPVGAPRGVLVGGVAALGRLRGVLDAAEARFVAAIDDLDDLDDRGLDAAGVLRAVNHYSRREADKRARRAEALASMPDLAAGLASAAIPSETVDALVRAASLVSAEAVNGDKQLLATCGSRPADLASREIRDWVRRHQSPGDAEQRLAAQRTARGAIWFNNPAGMLVCNIEFDPVTGAGARARLEAETEALWRSDGGRDGTPNDVRTPAQRRCDAVARLFGVAGPHAADSALPGSATGRVAATVLVVADIGVLDGTDPGGRCEIIDTGPVPASVLADLSSDTTWHGALFDGPGRPLWLGRGRRLANSHQRLIAAARDRGCINCGAPTNRCHIHHVHEWKQGGATDIDLLALLCPRCHTLVHDGHIQLHRLADGRWIAQSLTKSGRSSPETRAAGRSP